LTSTYGREGVFHGASKKKHYLVTWEARAVQAKKMAAKESARRRSRRDGKAVLEALAAGSDLSFGTGRWEDATFRGLGQQENSSYERGRYFLITNATEKTARP